MGWIDRNRLLCQVIAGLLLVVGLVMITAPFVGTPDHSILFQHKHQQQLVAGFVVLLVALVAFVVDFWLVETGRMSISMRTWIQTESHPIIMVFGVCLLLGIGYLVRDEWLLVYFDGLLAGHLFCHA